MTPNLQLREDQKRDPIVHEAFSFMTVFNLCRELHVLPRAGGILDQDSYFVLLMNHAMSCINDRQELDRRKTESGTPSIPRR
jgi:hypothetical protein